MKPVVYFGHSMREYNITIDGIETRKASCAMRE